MHLKMSSAKWWQFLSQPQMFKGMVFIFQQLRMHPTVHSRYIAVTFLQIIQERTGLKFCLTHEVLCLVQSVVLYCYAIYRKSAVFAFISIWIVLSHSAGPGFCWNLSYIVMPYVIWYQMPCLLNFAQYANKLGQYLSWWWHVAYPVPSRHQGKCLQIKWDKLRIAPMNWVTNVVFFSNGSSHISVPSHYLGKCLFIIYWIQKASLRSTSGKRVKIGFGAGLASVRRQAIT